MTESILERLARTTRERQAAQQRKPIPLQRLQQRPALTPPSMAGATREPVEIWNQKRFPVVYRPSSGRLIVKLPYRDGNKDWLRHHEGRHKPKWDPDRKWWECPRSWFEDLVKRAVHRFDAVYVIQPIITHEVCAPACWNAVGLECECSCMGANHGSQSGEGWREISETFAIRYNGRELACRLIKKK